MWVSDLLRKEYLEYMRDSKKTAEEIIEEEKNKALLMLSELDTLVEQKEKDLKDNKLKKITDFQLKLIENDILKLNSIFHNNKDIFEDYYLESYALVFKCSDWEYEGEEEKELYSKLSSLNSIIKKIQFFTYEVKNNENKLAYERKVYTSNANFKAFLITLVSILVLFIISLLLQ